MATTLNAEVLRDDIAVSLARATAVANRRARELGVDVDQSLITITQLSVDGGRIWRLNYGPKNYIGQRGGDLLLEVDPSDTSIKRELRGQ